MPPVTEKTWHHSVHLEASSCWVDHTFSLAIHYFIVHVK